MKPVIETTKKNGRPLSFERQEVLEKAMLTFWRHGYETTSISNLTAAMGVTAPSIYSAFGDKKTLFLEAMHLYAGSPEDFKFSLWEAHTSREAIHAMLLSTAHAFTAKNMPRGCLLASATASGSKDSADVQAAVAKVRASIIEILRERIEKDVEQGKLSKKIRPLSLARLVVSIVQGMSALARDGVGRKGLEEMVETAMLGWPD